MGRKNRRNPAEYNRGLGFDPRKYISRVSPEKKKSKDQRGRVPRRGDIWFADLGDHWDSSVQGGCRPVVVVSNDIGNMHAETINVIPMTSQLKKPGLPCHTGIEEDDLDDIRQHLDASMILTEQITTISKGQMKNYVGRVDNPAAMKRIEKAIEEQLDLKGIESPASVISSEACLPLIQESSVCSVPEGSPSVAGPTTAGR